MDDMEIALSVRKLVAEQCCMDLEKVNAGSNIIDDLQADSLDFVETVMQIEEEFDIVLHDDELQKVQTVGDLIELVQEKH